LVRSTSPSRFWALNNNALAALTCPDTFRRLDRHVGPDLAAVRNRLREASAA
jgi:hypothetical protein